jgi:hypothetical protein
MKILSPGHKYALAAFEGGQEQHLQFIEKDIAGNLISDGTTNEEVLAMMIDRMGVLNQKVPCRETSLAITKLEEALLWLNKRTADRIERGVEGTGKP